MIRSLCRLAFAASVFVGIASVDLRGAVQLKMPEPANITVDFERHIHPIFEAHCFKCHGPEKQRSDYRLDIKAVAFAGGAGGEPPIVPGRSEDSLLVQYVSGLDEEMMMPSEGDPLTPKQIGLLRAWIDQGASWPEHASAKLEDGSDWWSLQPLRRPSVPVVTKAARTPIDAFIHAKLAENNLAISPEADRRTLIRRASLTLIGLPPSPEETHAFIHDNDPQAYENLIDRLLASPRFGERWAQHWLDVIRFAETNGSESNLYRKNAWPYRDYVIRALNEDKPFDRFIHEQIAGDVLGVDEATGYLVAGVFVTADTVGKEESAIKQARADRLDEMVQTVSASLLGVTMACARCHNHKFDPIPQKDYYALTAVFQGVEYGYRPWKTMPQADVRAAQAAKVEQELATVREELRALTPVWTEEWPTHRQTHFTPVKTRALRFSFPAKQGASIDEIEIFGPATGNRNLALASRGTKARSHKESEDETRPVSNVIDGIADRFHNWRPRERGDEMQGDTWIEIELPSDAVVDRISISTDRDTLLTADFLVGRPSNGPKAYQIEALNENGGWDDVANVKPEKETNAAPDKVARLLTRIDGLTRDMSALQPPPLFAGTFVTPAKTHLLGRGDPMDPREEVAPNALSILKADLGLRSSSSDAVRRLAFAEWITDPRANPLTPRVLANRIWMHVFGSGIVDTPGDFGKVGGAPTHPELLEWLAAEFVDGGWSMKRLIRLQMTSDAFRQSSAPNAEFAQIDAQSRYLWRFPPRRIEAEVLRDGALQVAGTLDLTMGGPGFRIHGDKKRFEGWKVVDNAGPTTWRRMIYQERMRGIDDQMFTAFDRPECGQVMPKRTNSTTPLQALNLFNGEFVLIQANKFAERIVREAGPEPDAQIQHAFALAFCRTPSANEAQAALALVAEDGLPALCRALLNANEYAYIE